MGDPTNEAQAGQIAPRRLVSRFLRDRTGASAIEFAILALPFFLLVFAVLELCILFAARQLMTNATDALARQVATGRSQTTVRNLAEAERFLCARMEILFPSNCPGLTVALEPAKTFKDAADLFDTNPTVSDFNPGGALEINVLRVYYPWPVITDIMRKRISNDGGKTLLFATNTWRNEPF